MYQCTRCSYTAPIKTNVMSHITNNCPGAEILNQKCLLYVRPLGDKTFGATVTQGDTSINAAIAGDHNHLTQNITVNVQPVFYVGSEEERSKLHALFRDPEALKDMFASGDPADIPAKLFSLWKGVDAPPELHNIKVVGNRVEECRGPGNVVSVPRSKYLKKAVGDLFGTVAQASCSADDDKLRAVQDDLDRPQFGLGKKARVSASEAVRLHATASKQAYDLDADARTMIRDSSSRLDRELDHYAREVAPGF
jgi:hypothetical protein